MISDSTLRLKEYLFWAVIFGVIVLAIFLVLPFMVAVFSAYMLAYMLRPLFSKLILRMPSNVAGAICVLVAIIIVVVPLSLVLLEMANQAGSFASAQNILHYINLIASHPFLSGFNFDAATMQYEFNQIIATFRDSFLTSLPALAVGLIITLIGMYYMLCDWENLSRQLRKHIPFANKERIITELNQTTQVILYGILTMAILEFVIAYVGFTFLGVEASLILAALVFVLAFIPSIGTIFVWIPLALYYLTVQEYSIALGVVIIGFVLTLGIEVLFYTKWVRDRTRIHPLVMLLGVLGGINLVGVFGVILGPLILAGALDLIKGAMPAD